MWFFKDMVLEFLKKLAKGEDIGNTTTPGTPASVAKALWDRWNEIPKDIQDKIIAEEIKRDPVAFANYMVLLSFGGDAEGMLKDWALENVVPKLECVAWGDLRTGYIDEAGHWIKPGKYIMLYRLTGEDICLYFGPGAAGGAAHQVRGEKWGTIDQLSGTTGPADLWCLTWQNTSEGLMDITIYALNFTDHEIIITIYGSTKIIEYEDGELNNEGDIIKKQKTIVDRFTFTIPICRKSLFGSGANYRGTSLGHSYRFYHHSWSEWTIKFGYITVYP
jgi:hypothetical protein